ncbi:hypothetical protein FRB94_007818 [Tulasnella sp. JGI-2019a]|nr:hypothetical protein FRB93_007354 [Tulasnella sp. JGI-2019a]KAG8997211.1 hypothetical protein FRB94_007818 [Tulasnella sp. JGI-2019a]KAG9027689.1 hypothetical protein FRB95_007460 [Tulasnella sp. JGI-2019a]
MAHSLTPECTPLKLAYDSCFNAWFEGYLQPIASSGQGPFSMEEKLAQNRAKAEDYEARCGKIWQSYRTCVQKAVKGSGLTKMIREAQEEHPLATPPGSPTGSQTSSSTSSSFSSSSSSSSSILTSSS